MNKYTLTYHSSNAEEHDKRNPFSLSEKDIAEAVKNTEFIVESKSIPDAVQMAKKELIELMAFQCGEWLGEEDVEFLKRGDFHCSFNIVKVELFKE